MADENNVSAADAADGKGPEDKGAKKKGGALGLIIGLVLALGLGAGTAFAVMSGLVPLPGKEAEKESAEPKPEELPPAPSFVALDPITVTIGQPTAPRQLRLALSIETSDVFAERVEGARPRILDALNTLLRAVDEDDLAQPWALDRLRAQMLRRVRIATDPTAIQDLLITEYVIF